MIKTVGLQLDEYCRRLCFSSALKESEIREMDDPPVQKYFETRFLGGHFG